MSSVGSEREPEFLVVDDNPAHRKQLCRALRTLGKAHELSRGEEVVSALRAGSFQLVCLDLSLPEISGYEVCRQIRAANLAVKVLAIGERISVTDRAFAREVGADDILEKPFRVRELMRRVDALLRGIEPRAKATPFAREVSRD